MPKTPRAAEAFKSEHECDSSSVCAEEMKQLAAPLTNRTIDDDD